MKILFLSGEYPSTENQITSIFIHNQVKALQSKGIEVAVLVVDIRSIRKKRKYGYTKRTFDGVQVYQYAIPCGPIPYLAAILSKIAALRGFKKLIKEFGMPDIVHAHFTLPGYCAHYIKEKYGIPYVLTEHSSGLMKNKIKWRIKRIAKIAYNNSDKLIAVGNGLKAKMHDLTEKDISVIYNIIPSYFQVSGYKKYKNFTFITIGWLITRKRMDLTISAFAKLYSLSPDIKLKIVGTGPLLIKLKTMCKKLNIEDAVDFVGFCTNEKLPELYNQCQCFVLPSEAETFGLVYAEATACGIPVIATNCGGPSDIVEQSNGLLIQKGSEQELVNAMKYVLKNSDKYNAHQISNDTLDKFGEKSISAKLIYLYSGVINECLH